MRSSVTSKTRLLCVIGDPVGHSASPAVHNAAFKAARIDAVYVAFRVSPAELEGVVKSLRSMGVWGFNVTIPHKITIMPLLDELGASAYRVGAVNTVVNDDERLIGYNTDIEGFLAPLRKRIRLKGVEAMVLGTGGAARAVVQGLCDEGAGVIHVASRSLEKAEGFCRSHFHCEDARLNPLSLNETSFRELNACELVINATPLGMAPNKDRTPLNPQLLHPEMTVYDLVYNPVKTILTQDASKAGCKVIYGWEMFLSQAAASFEMWTGKEPSAKSMRNALRRELMN
jgi:shikimate dehydrogenase